MKKTTLTQWFAKNAEERILKLTDKQRGYDINGEVLPEAKDLLYVEFPAYYCWNKQKKCWTRRKKLSDDSLGRPYGAHPSEGERYYLRMLLFHVRAAESFTDLRKVENIVKPTFKQACIDRGLLEDDSELLTCLQEAVLQHNGKMLRELFVLMLIHCEPTNPLELYNTFKVDLCMDFYCKSDEQKMTRL